MKFRIYADLHIGSPIEIMKYEALSEPISYTTVFIGDIIDGANCEKDKVFEYKALYKVLRDTHPGNYICGNHSRMTTANEIIIKKSDSGKSILFAHGDLEANKEKWTEYRSKPWGAGWFKRKFIIPFIREAEEIIDRTPKKDFLDNAAKLARKNNCHIATFGHFHPKEVIDVMHEEIRIIVVPRGLTILDL